MISSWLQQTVIYNPSAWIDLCQRIMARTTASQQVADAATHQNLRDDEGESLNAKLSQDSKAGGRSRLRWRTQLLALQCLHEICASVTNSGRREHLDAIIARTQGIPSAGLLFSRVSDLIKMAFTASTAYVTEICLAGLVVLRDVIEVCHMWYFFLPYAQLTFCIDVRHLARSRIRRRPSTRAASGAHHCRPHAGILF